MTLKVNGFITRAIFICATTLSFANCTAKPSSSKNVVLLFFDDLRFDPFSYLGGPAATPHIDALAKEGIRFNSAMTTTGLCSPSRAALFTGRWGHRTGLDDNINLWHSKNPGLVASETTIFEWAIKKGYRVGYYGKWHLGPVSPELRGIKHASEEIIGNEKHRSYVPVEDLTIIKGYYNSVDNSTEKELYYKTLPNSYAETGLKQKVNQGISFLTQAAKSDSAFFLTLSFNQPHPPYKVPEPYSSMYKPEDVKMPLSFNDDLRKKSLAQSQVLWPWHDVGHMTEMDWKKTIAHFYGAVSMIDHAIGEIIETLKATGNYENTMIIVLGDQGSMMGEHGLYDKGPYSYDELMRIPMIIKVPGKQSHDIDRQVSILDLNQTMVEWMDLKPMQANVDSRSLFPLINKDDKAWKGDDLAFYHYEWYNGSWFGVRTIRTPEWKYCWNAADVDEMYDLKKDPIEMNNLYDNPNYKETANDLMLKLLDHLKSIDDPLHSWLAEEMEKQ